MRSCCKASRMRHHRSGRPQPGDERHLSDETNVGSYEVNPDGHLRSCHLRRATVKRNVPFSLYISGLDIQDLSELIPLDGLAATFITSALRLLLSVFVVAVETVSSKTTKCSLQSVALASHLWLFLGSRVG